MSVSKLHLPFSGCFKIAPHQEALGKMEWKGCAGKDMEVLCFANAVE